MSPHLPRLTAKEIIAVIEKVGFSFSRQSGSHKIYKNNNWQRVTIPFHGSKILHHIAAGALAFKGIILEPALAAVFMSASTVIVAINAILLRRKEL